MKLFGPNARCDCNRLTLFTVSLCEREAKRKTRRHPGEMTVLLLFQKTAGYNQLLPLPRPLNNSRPIGALLFPCASTVTPLSEVSYTPFGTAETHQCPSLKQENSLIFGPWLPIHVFFIQKLHNVTLFIRIQFNWLTLVFGHHLKCDWFLTFMELYHLKKNLRKKNRLKIHWTAKNKEEYNTSEWKKQARIRLYHYSGKQNKGIKQEKR